MGWRVLIEPWSGITAKDPTIIHCENMVALAYVKNPKYHEKSKQILYHYTCDIVRKREVVLKHISMTSMVVDPLVKLFPEMYSRLL